MKHETNSTRLNFLAPVLEPGDAHCVLRNQRTGAVLVRHLETAFDSAARRKGLLGRTGLLSDAGMVIAPCSSVHTFFMRFTIDVLFVDRGGTVVKCYRGLRPWRIAFAIRSFAVVELSAGSVDRSGTVVGDRLVVAP